jgi:hypothetical protein
MNYAALDPCIAQLFSIPSPASPEKNYPLGKVMDLIDLCFSWLILCLQYTFLAGHHPDLASSVFSHDGNCLLASSMVARTAFVVVVSLERL